ncbi:MAG: GNAT family N-acetyltransferase [Burkholderiales bacterium]
MPTEAQIEIAASLSAVDAAEWDALAGPQPFIRHAFLHTLETTGCVGANTGWTPQHLLLKREGRLAAALPLYLRDDSYGEFVFDFAWADAYARYGGRYYPKLLTAIPFTPVAGRRLLAHNDADRLLLIDTVLDLARHLRVSSWHCLFPTAHEAELLAAKGLMQRHGVQFHWRNAGYANFDAYLATMSHDKRKKIKQERRKVSEAGVTFQHRVGTEITEEDWLFFYECYRHTYLTHHSPPYMNLAFFREIGQRLAADVMLMIGYQAGKPIAVALNLFDDERLYGRYWGATCFISGLHFETCYYQAIEFAIARGMPVFEGGAQGEHKLARGLLPVTTTSAHWIADENFARAVGDFLVREQQGVAQYVCELNESAPFRAGVVVPE